MREIALHILDVAENGITAGAGVIEIEVVEARRGNLLTVVIRDNGSGIPHDMIAKVTDPFVTSRTTRRVGLGLSLFRMASIQCEGDFSVESEPGRGTSVSATFLFDHIDRAPVGDMASTVTTLIAGNPGVEFVYTHRVDDEEFVFDTREIREELDGPSLSDPRVLTLLNETIREALARLEPPGENPRERG